MKSIKALVVLYAGDEISYNTLAQIKYLIHNDVPANGQGITAVQLSSEEIAQLASEAAANAVRKVNDREIQINIKDDSYSSELQAACTLIGTTFNPRGSSKIEITPMQMVVKYLDDPKVKDAFQCINNYTDKEILRNNAAIHFKFDNSFVKTIREIVKNL